VQRTDLHRLKRRPVRGLRPQWRAAGPAEDPADVVAAASHAVMDARLALEDLEGVAPDQNHIVGPAARGLLALTAITGGHAENRRGDPEPHLAAGAAAL